MMQQGIIKRHQISPNVHQMSPNVHQMSPNVHQISPSVQQIQHFTKFRPRMTSGPTHMAMNGLLISYKFEIKNMIKLRLFHICQSKF